MGGATFRNGNRTRIRLQNPHLGYTVLRDPELHLGHAEDQEVVVDLQRYGNRVCLAFGDAGVGIPTCLEGRYPGESAGEIIAHALEPQVSSRIGRGGMGLTELVELVRERTGRMTIHSAGGQVEVTRDGVSPRDGCCRIRGTLVEVEL